MQPRVGASMSTRIAARYVIDHPILALISDIYTDFTAMIPRVVAKAVRADTRRWGAAVVER